MSNQSASETAFDALGHPMRRRMLDVDVRPWSVRVVGRPQSAYDSGTIRVDTQIRFQALIVVITMTS